MTTTQKHPSPGEYWRSRSGEIRLIVCDARQHNSDFSGPYPIVSMSKSGGITTHDASGSDYNDTDESPNDLLEHLSDCTGFDWNPPAPIDPGDGWELLPVGTVLQEGDEVYSEKNGWCKTCNVGIEVGNQIKGTDCIYRRRKPIAEWPKYIVNDDWSFTAYLIRDSETSYAAVHVDGTDEGAKIWDKHCSILIDQGTWRYVTEAEALARVKTTETWPKYYVGEMWTDADAYLRIDNAELDGVWVGEDGDEIKYRKHDERTLQERITEHKWRYVTEAEALARVKPAEPIAADRIPDHRPAREVIMDVLEWLNPEDETAPTNVAAAVETIEQWLEDNPEDSSPFAKPFTDARSGIGIRKEQFVEDPICPNRPGDSGYDPHADELCQMCGEPAIPGTGGCRECTQYAIEATRCPVERTATPLVTAVVESPDDWVEITDTHPGHIRRECDEVCRKDDNPPNWIPVRSSVGMPQSEWFFTRIRCRRRDLPAQQPAIDEPERWFMWSDDRYPIAFVKRAGGKVFNLNVDGLFKTSDDWGPVYEEKLINGELIEVTERSAKAYLRRPRRKIIDTPAPQPKRTPVRIGIQKNGVLFAVVNPKALDGNKEIKCPGGFYLEGE